MRKKINKIVAHPAGMTLVMTATIIIWGVFAYMFQILMMRWLPNHEFLEFQRYISFSNIVGTLSSGLVLYMTYNAMSTHDNISLQKSFRYGLFQILKRYILRIILFSWLIVTCSSLLFGLHNIFYLLVIRIGLVVWVIGASILWWLRGTQRFTPLLGIQILWPILKLWFWILFVHIGLQWFGAFLASSISGMIPILLVIIVIRYHYRDVVPDEKPSLLPIKLSQFLENSAIVILLGFLLNIDVVFISTIVETKLWSIYAGVSLLAKSMAFLISALEIVLLAKIVEQTDKKHIRYPLRGIMFTMVFALICIFFLGDTILYFMKPELWWYGRLLSDIVIIMASFGVISFYSQYLILQGNRSNLYRIWALIVLWYVFVQWWWMYTLTQYIGSLVVLFFASMVSTLFQVCSWVHKGKRLKDVPNTLELLT